MLHSIATKQTPIHKDIRGKHCITFWILLVDTRCSDVKKLILINGNDLWDNPMQT